MAEPTGVETPAEDTAYFDPELADDSSGEETPSEYTSESSEAAAPRAVRRPVITGNAAGTGQWSINGRPLDSYFPNKVHQQIVSEPFVLIGAEGQFDVIARIGGGGVTGQAGALRLGVARALILVDPENRPPLKKAGFLTSDARVTERKKYGLKKARKAPQYSKR